MKRREMRSRSVRVNAVTANAAALAAIVLVGTANAQPPAPLQAAPRRPVYSPYLNLNRAGASTAQNYFGLVRPELEFRSGLNQLRQDTQALATGLAATQPGGELTTGHASGYMTHLRYYGTNGSGANGGTRGATAAPVGGGGRGAHAKR